MARGESLTPKQEAFIAAYLETGNASEAYRRAYDCRNMKSESVNRLAFALLENVKIASRVQQTRREVRQSVKITLQSHLETLERLRNKAEEAGQYAPAIKAEEQRGKASGIYTAAEEDEKEVRTLPNEAIAEELARIQDMLAALAGARAA